MNPRALFVAPFALATLCVEPANADDWGCEVLLCLSNPAGPTAVEQCKPPIQRLWDHLRHGHEFPTCDMAKSNKGRSFAKQGFNHYDMCPLGTKALANGERAVEGTTPKRVGLFPRAATTGTVQVGIGNGDGYSIWNRYDRAQPKSCVGTKVGVTWQSHDGRSRYPVTIYDRIISLPPHSSPNIIDLYINDAFYQRVRW